MDLSQGLLSAIGISLLTISAVPIPIAIGGSLLIGCSVALISEPEEDLWTRLDIKSKGGLYPVKINERKTENGFEKVFFLPNGLCFEDVLKYKSEIENYYKKPITLEKTKNYNLVLKCFEKDLEKMYPLLKPEIPLKPKLFLIGFKLGLDGKKPIFLDLGSSDAHLLISGCTGSGKSVLVRSIISQFIYQTKGDPRHGKIFISDLKGGVSTKIFSRSKNCIKYTIYPEEAIRMMSEVYDLMMERYHELTREDSFDYIDYNKNHKKKMEPIIFLIEEYSLLFAEKEACEKMFTLLNLSRAANISIILTIQRPDYKTLDTRIKANLKASISFRMKTDVDSEIVLGKGCYQASRLLKTSPVGRCIMNDENHSDEILQSCFISSDEIEDLLKDQLIRKATISTYKDEEKRQARSERPKSSQRSVMNTLDLL